MTTITKERLLTIQQWRETYGPGSNVVLPAEEAEELARIALASIESEPVAWKVTFTQIDREYNTFTGMYSDKAEVERWVRLHKACNFRADITPIYTAPPVPVVPEEKPMPNPLSMYAVDAVAAIAEVRGWNACRAAMLHGTEPVSQTYKLNELPGNSPVTPDSWISCSERMPNDKQYVWCWGKSYGWTEYDTFEGYYDWSRNKWWAVTDNGEEPASKVTHWMPLPEPPQEVNRG
ncbi:DUF551 domain-containing protein [Escherichia coli]|nr:DUF551 domain-containing protein [Escherichia coli]EGK7429296.1 DUF551 domain-containing protein [Escherichia coli]EHP9671403.1 DUF551 domain-containing protein [Escherichia coli]EJZ3309952.1 DUF551 domain-containing protein [Escherichia coli]EKH9305684.1 DUF551 domain-containing protein [Escherichia coli]